MYKRKKEKALKFLKCFTVLAFNFRQTNLKSLKWKEKFT